MSGIYLHIPFCKKACHYCNFHFMTSLKLKDDMVDALCREIEMRADYLQERALASIYFGGGTPSILSKSDLEKILQTLSRYYSWNQDAEITLEANPDDLSKEKIAMLKGFGVNRLSIGIQSFFDSDLQWMNRAHHAGEAVSAILHSQKAGISNLTIDLIYGSPYTTHEMWQENIQKAVDMGVQHISAYCLTVEVKTALYDMIKKGRFQALNPDHANEQFAYLIETLTSQGYEHYEISNFAKAGHIAVHNTNYWKGEKYIGIGPSAHSYNGQTRSWNIANNKKYIDAISSGVLPTETEYLTQETLYNEYIMTGLRTMWGVNAERIRKVHAACYGYFMEAVKKPLSEALIVVEDNNYVLTLAGKYFADRIAMDLFYIEDED